MRADPTPGSQLLATRKIPVSELLARHGGGNTARMPRRTSPATSTLEGDTCLAGSRVAGATDELPTITGAGHVTAHEGYRSCHGDLLATDGAHTDQYTALVSDGESTHRASDDGQSSDEIYIRELLVREGKLPKGERRGQVPKIAAAAAGVAALCGAVTATVLHVQSAENGTHLDADGAGVPLTVIDDGGPNGRALDAPVPTSQGGAMLLSPSDAGSSNQADEPDEIVTSGPRVAPYVPPIATTGTQRSTAGPTTSSGSTTTTTSKPPTTSTPAPTPPSSDPRPPTSGGGILGGLLGGLLG